MVERVREWWPVGFALSCVLAALSLCLHPESQLLRWYSLEDVSDVFVSAFLLGVVVLCLLVSVSAHDDEDRRWSIGVGVVSGSAGSVFAMSAQMLPPQVSAAGSGLLLGFGLTCLLRQWGRHYRFLSSRSVLVHTSVSFLIASCIWFALIHAGTPFLFGLGLLVLVCSGGMPLLARQIVHADEVRAGFRTDDRKKPFATMGQVVRQGWAAVVGLMFSFFVLGMAFVPEEAGLGAGGFPPKPLAYVVLVALVLLVFARGSQANRSDEHTLELFYCASLPFGGAAMLLCLARDPIALLTSMTPVSAVAYFGFALYHVLGLTVLFWTAKRTEVGYSKVFAAFCSTCALSMMAGIVAYQLVGTRAYLPVLCLFSAYLIVMLLGEVRIVFERRARTL